jgi:hypothetical protein
MRYSHEVRLNTSTRYGYTYEVLPRSTFIYIYEIQVHLWGTPTKYIYIHLRDTATPMRYSYEVHVCTSTTYSYTYEGQLQLKETDTPMRSSNIHEVQLYLWGTSTPSWHSLQSWSLTVKKYDASTCTYDVLVTYNWAYEPYTAGSSSGAASTWMVGSGSGSKCPGPLELC